jgi:hypothetical protein
MPDFDDIALDTDIDEAVALLDRGPAMPSFTLKESLVHFHRTAAKDRVSRRGIRKLIHPDNARFLLDHLPADEHERTHGILRGDFVLCDIIPLLIEARGRCPHLHIATLGLSTANAEALASLRARGLIDQITLVCSHYFSKVNRHSTYREVMAVLNGIARVVVTRSHAKVICMPTAAGDHFVIEGSANLRSSDNTEQITIYNDADLCGWHARWLEGLSES